MIRKVCLFIPKERIPNSSCVLNKIRVKLRRIKISINRHRFGYIVISTIIGGKQKRLFTPAHAQNVHFRSREWLERELSKPHDGPTIVVTHHAPHINSVHPMYIGTSPVNSCFASDLADILEKYDIDLWVHGHPHWTFDYTVFGTRVVCNPYGYYPSREINDFNKDLLIEVG